MFSLLLSIVLERFQFAFSRLRLVCVCVCLCLFVSKDDFKVCVRESNMYRTYVWTGLEPATEGYSLLYSSH